MGEDIGAELTFVISLVVAVKDMCIKDEVGGNGCAFLCGMCLYVVCVCVCICQCTTMEWQLRLILVGRNLRYS